MYDEMSISMSAVKKIEKIFMKHNVRMVAQHGDTLGVWFNGDDVRNFSLLEPPLFRPSVIRAIFSNHFTKLPEFYEEVLPLVAQLVEAKEIIESEGMEERSES